MTDSHTGRRLRVTLGSAVNPKRIEWWEPYWIALGALTLLAGREGLGKSTIAVHWAARETRAGRYVIYFHSEDSREHTVVPRLLAAGADLNFVIFIDVQTEYTENGTVILPYDLEALDQLILEYMVTFIVLDAATSAMSSTLSGKDDRQVRQYLEPLSQLAARHNIVILGLVHFGKRDGADSGKLILGSIAWSQVARSVLSVALDPDSGKLVVTNTKGNLAPRTRSVEAHIVSTAVVIDGEQTEIGVLEWLGETTADARDFLSGEDGQSNRDVDDWLREYLRAERRKATDVFQAADANGFSKDQVKRAKKRVGVNAIKEGPSWFWQLATIIDGEVEEESGAAHKGAEPPHARSLAPLLPSRSEGVQEVLPSPREQGSVHTPFTAPLLPKVCRDCNILLPATATGDQCDECADPARQPFRPPVERELHVVHDGRANRTPQRTCPYCAERLIHSDDLADGYHTSKGKCVRAHRKEPA
ncbi:MAG: AAA family ATPase [Gordonia sp. (in: high G+C Gram-positive bacteria)]|uniref:AAA family ATPase n=2 Tax=Gordonia sp. (in: high G+C Gram-positive bacteria) TaxID=84139 RepID=UPI003C7070A5